MTGGATVSRETSEKLKLYEQLLRKWSPKINLVARSTLADASSRHFADSARLLAFAPENPESWLDLGSGAGFPGLVCAIHALGRGWSTRFTLMESDARKSAFLAAVARETETPVQIITERIEEAAPQAAKVISARALAPLDKLLGYAERHRTDGTICLFHKGARAQSELTEARRSWTLDSVSHPGETGSEGVILRIERFARVID